ncbi:hypothetical protein OAZ88_00070 [bacterium]|nr:hypothetical protein [bacterium]
MIPPSLCILSTASHLGSAVRIAEPSEVSKSQLCLATRDHKDTKPINKWLDAAAVASGTNGSQGFPQDKDAAGLDGATFANNANGSQGFLLDFSGSAMASKMLC